MNQVSVFELENSRRRLVYYSQLKQKSGSKAPQAVEKWIEIYSERVQKLEKRFAKLEKQGLLRTNIGRAASTERTARRA